MIKEREVKISKEDCEYYEKIISGFEKLEKEIATLEIAKMKRMQNYSELEKLQINFTEQVKVKYGIVFEKGEIDIDEGVIRYEEFVDDDNEIKKEIIKEDNESKKNLKKKEKK